MSAFMEWAALLFMAMTVVALRLQTRSIDRINTEAYVPKHKRGELDPMQINPYQDRPGCSERRCFERGRYAGLAVREAQVADMMDALNKVRLVMGGDKSIGPYTDGMLCDYVTLVLERNK